MFSTRDLTARNMVKKHAIENAKNMTELIAAVSKVVDQVHANTLNNERLMSSLENMASTLTDLTRLVVIDSETVASLEARVSELEVRINVAEDAGRI